MFLVGYTPALSTTLVKVPLLVSWTVYNYYGMTPPTNKAPPLKKGPKASGKDWLTKTTPVQIALAAIEKYALGALALTEAALLVAASLPSPPARILSAAAPLRLSPYAFAGLSLSLAGGALRVACHHALGRFFVWAVGLHASHSLVTSGPYAIVRHPAYTGYFLMIFGPAVLCFDRGSLFGASGLGRTFLGRAAGVVCLLHIAAVSFGMVGRTKQEDEMLREEFGEEWEAWAKRTPYRLIPYVW